MLNKFSKDPNYLIRYFLLNLGIFTLLNFSLVSFELSFLHFSWNLGLLLIIPIALVLGLVSATAFHNASHGNIKPRILNSLIGELTANLSLEDLRCFTVGHMLHHKHTDHPTLDPHPPQRMTFLQFILNSRQSTIAVISQFYFKKHGVAAAQKRNVKLQIGIYHLLSLSKLAFWFLLFGWLGFLLLYLPSFLSYFFGFAHLNYISHQPDQSGEVTIHDRDGKLFYRLMNMLTAGGYYHKSHHLYPGFYNPSKARPKIAVRKQLPKLRIARYE